MIRWDLLANPVNWIIVFLMLTIAAFAGTLVMRKPGSE